MCMFCCEHNEGSSCFYKRVFHRCTNRMEFIEYTTNYGFIMPGVMTTNGIAILIYNSLSDVDKMEFLEYVKETISKDKYEIFERLVRD